MKITAKKLGKLVAAMGATLVLLGMAPAAFAGLQDFCTGAQLCNSYWKQSLVNGKWKSDSKGVCVKAGTEYKWVKASLLPVNDQVACLCPKNTATEKYNCSR